jgi:hypothetical protein
MDQKLQSAFQKSIELEKNEKKSKPKTKKDKDIPTILFPPSEEQQLVINKVCDGKNVLVDSVAGSGKTTCNLHLARVLERHQKNILLLTYNAKLKVETRQKAATLNIHNLEVHSYHSFCVKYYCESCYTDSEMREILHKDLPPLSQFFFDVIVADEAQDITPLYYRLIHKIFHNNRKNKKDTQFCLFGDRNQSIFEFNGADARYISLARDVFRLNELDWEEVKLSTSYRITKEMSEFINTSMLGYPRILSHKKINHNLTIKPRFLIYDTLDSIYQEVIFYLEIKKYKPSDIFVLAPSIKNPDGHPRRLENMIKKNLPHVLVFVPVSDEEKLDDSVIDNKLLFSTFHQTKGMERKVVIVFNFDNSYFEYFHKNADTYVCPNELYVATTRAQEYLTILQHSKNKFLPFLKKSSLENTCEILNPSLVSNKMTKVTKTPRDNELKVSVSELLRFLSADDIDICYNLLTITSNKELKKSKIKVESKIRNKSQKNFENVSDITGIAIPIYFEYKQKNKLDILDCLLTSGFEKQFEGKHSPFQKFRLADLAHKFFGASQSASESADQIPINSDSRYISSDAPCALDSNPKSINEAILFLANCWATYMNGYHYKLYQINEYKWLPQDKLEAGYNRCCALGISLDSQFELCVSVCGHPELRSRTLVGFIDCIDYETNTIYEFKCVDELKKEHYLQLACYMYIVEKNNHKKIQHKYILYNIIQNECFTVSCETEKLDFLIDYLFYLKYEKKFKSKSKDAEFIEQNLASISYTQKKL